MPPWRQPGISAAPADLPSESSVKPDPANRKKIMKAAFYEGNHVIRVRDTEPVPPQPDEVRLDVAFAGICGTDLHIYHGALDWRVRIPQVIGHEMSGTVAEVGTAVGDFQPGDRVVVRPQDCRGETPADRGLSHLCATATTLGIDTTGAFQSSWTVPACTVHRLPAGVGFEVGALAEPFAVAWHAVRMAKLVPGELVLVAGGGPIGLLTALAARHAGARAVVSEIAPYRRQFAGQLGFETIDPARDDAVRWVRDRSEGRGADVFFEASGARAAVRTMTDLLAPRGRAVIVAIHAQPVEVNLFHVFWKELLLVGARSYERIDYDEILPLMAEGALPLARLITGIQPLERIGDVFHDLDTNPEAMKMLIDCRT